MPKYRGYKILVKVSSNILPTSLFTSYHSSLTCKHFPYMVGIKINTSHSHKINTESILLRNDDIDVYMIKRNMSD